MKLGRDEFSLPAHVLRHLSDPPCGGSTAGQEGVKESFKDKRLYLECCHSGSDIGQMFQGVDPGRAKKGRGRASPLTKSSFRPNIHSNILMYCRRHCRHIYLNTVILVVFFLTELFAVGYQVSD